MTSKALAELNFDRLIQYRSGPPKPEFEYTQPLVCDGFCIACEQRGVLAGSDKRLYLMSHGADTSDFESIYGTELPLDDDRGYVMIPIMFVLESPGGEHNNGVPQSFHGIEKAPPVCHYYWMPEPEPSWPSRDETLQSGNKYGPYFAFLLRRHRLKNAYFTNVVKCGLSNQGGSFVSYSQSVPLHRAIRDNCCQEFLEREVAVFQPAIVFAFGDQAHRLFRTSSIGERIRLQVLYHPAARMSGQDILEQNDAIIEKALAEVLR
jgi:Uracil DNA glycosylase superfamily